MSNIVDYIKWRGDLSLEVSPLNEIDNLILSRISYLPFERINFKDKDSFVELADQFLELKKEDFHQIDDIMLVEELSKSIRFKNLLFSDYFDKIDPLEEIQFSAITIWLPNNEIFVSYRGTDATLVGWKEDFNMSFMSNVPSQIEGVKYLENIARKYPRKKIRIGGHSKGGNVAVYSGIFCNNKIKNRIIEIINADGPGFDSSIIKTGEYRDILNRIHTYIPQSSVIGRLLEHEEEYKIVESIQKGIMQHDIYSWQVEGPKIVSISENTNGSEIVNGVVRSWLKNTTPEQRKNFINIIYDVLSTTNVSSIHDLSMGLFKNIGIVVDTYKNIDENEKREIKEILKILVKTSFHTLKEEIPIYRDSKRK